MPPAEATSLGRRMVAGAGWMMAWRMATRALGFVNTLVLARLLVPADFGLVAMATTFAGAVSSLSQFSIQDALIRRVEDDTRLHDSAFTIQLGRAVLTAAILALAAPLAARWFSEPRLTSVVLVLSVFVAVGGLENIGTVQFQRQMRFDVQFRMMIIPRVLQVAATLATALLTRSYWALLVGIGIGKVSQVAVTYAVHPYRPRLSLVGWQELAGFSFWLWVAGLASLVWDRSDVFIVGGFFGSAKLGLFMLGIEVAILPIMEVVAPAASVLLAGFAFSQRTGGRAGANALPLVGVLLLGVIPVALVLSAGASDVVAVLLGRQWAAAVPLVEIAAGICVFSPVSYVCMAVLITIGQVRRQFYAVAGAAALKLVVVYVAARFFNLRVVAAGLVACVAIEAALYLWQLRIVGYARLRRSAFGLLRVLLAGGVTCAVLTQIGGTWTRAAPVAFVGSRYIDSLLELVLLGAVSAVTFSCCVAVFWLASGRPEGPERILARVVAETIAPRLRRIG